MTLLGVEVLGQGDQRGRETVENFTVGLLWLMKVNDRQTPNEKL